MYRVLLGAWLLVRLVTAATLGSTAHIVVAIGIALCLILMVGWYDRVAAGALIVVQLAMLRLENPEPGNFATWIATAIAIALPVLHAMTPAAPYGSWAARARGDPAAGWQMSKITGAMAWTLLSAIYLSAAIFNEPSAESGLVGWLRWLLVGSWIAFVPLATWPTCRKWIWLASLVLDTVVLGGLGHASAVMALGLLHVLTFHPSWLPSQPAPEAEIIFYDGHCGLCHRWVRFVLAEDPAGKAFILSPLQGQLIQQKVPDNRRDDLPDSIVLWRADGELLLRSTVVLHILHRLGGWWRVGAWLGRLIPRGLRDVVYDGLAAVRHKIYRRPEEACPMVPAHLRERFR